MATEQAAAGNPAVIFDCADNHREYFDSPGSARLRRQIDLLLRSVNALRDESLPPVSPPPTDGGPAPDPDGPYCWHDDRYIYLEYHPEVLARQEVDLSVGQGVVFVRVARR